MFRLRGSESALWVARTTVRADVETTAKTLKAAVSEGAGGRATGVSPVVCMTVSVMF